METTGHGLYRAEHRALRELYARARQLCGHWDEARRPDRRPAGAAAAPRRGGLRASCSTSSPTAPRSAACTASRPRTASEHASPALRNNAGDLLLERNQALRAAVLDVQHVTTLLGYLGRLAATRGDDELAGFHRGWEARLREIEAEARDAAVELGCDPPGAVIPAEQSPLGRAGHRVAAAIGTRGRGDRQLRGRPCGAPLRARPRLRLRPRGAGRRG